mmetsp:Transcript_20070/g.47049  ORF Transcript_20070/g.47049 Transcript_20070/m.47049 type:complete len:242 (-) Transcript_20070:389-1114(-)
MFGSIRERAPMGRGCLMVPRVKCSGRRRTTCRRRRRRTPTPPSRFPSRRPPAGRRPSFGRRGTTANFESLRWKYHQDFAERHVDGGTKSMIDVDKHELSPSEGFKSRRANRASCRASIEPAAAVPDAEPFGGTICESRYHQHEQPLAIYHYLGSLERYLFRGDVRRNANIHASAGKRASHAKGDVYGPEEEDADEEERRWWIKGWFDSFVETHGADAAYSVFGAAYAERMSESAAKRTARP